MLRVALYSPPAPDAENVNNPGDKEDRNMPSLVLSIDIWTNRVSLAISDELRLTLPPLPPLPRTPWKRLLSSLSETCEKLDVRSIDLGLPLRLDGSEGDA